MYFLPFQVHYICCRFPVSPSTWMCVWNLFHDRTVFKGVQKVTLSKCKTLYILVKNDTEELSQEQNIENQ